MRAFSHLFSGGDWGPSATYSVMETEYIDLKWELVATALASGKTIGQAMAKEMAYHTVMKTIKDGLLAEILCLPEQDGPKVGFY